VTAFIGACPSSPAASRKLPSERCAPQAFAVSWSIARTISAVMAQQSTATGGRMTSGCPMSSRCSPARLAAGKAPTSARISARKKRPDAQRCRTTHVGLLNQTASCKPFLAAGSRHSGAATAQRAILGARNELAGHSPYGNRRNSVGVGGQFLASATGTYVSNDQRRAATSKSNR
jgi:hypothetical protein